MPPYDPSGPDNDGFANIRFTHEGLVLELSAGQRVLVPSITIHKASMIIKPGSDNMVNIVQLELLAGEVEVCDDSFPEEFRVQPSANVSPVPLLSLGPDA